MEALVTDDGKKMSGAVIEVFKNGKFVEKVKTDGKGRAYIPMDAGGVYTITISGEGKILKKIEVDTKNTPADLNEPLFYPAEVDIFDKVDGIDYSILNQPIGKITFDPEYGDFSADASHTKKVQSALKKMTDDYMTQKAEVLKNEKENQKLYDAAVKIADKAFANEKWEEAEVEYKKAAALMPTEMHPQFQLAELKTKLIEIRKKNEKYNQAIVAAEAAEKAKDYPTAIAEFKRASGYRPNEAYPSDKAKELQATLANAAKVEQDYLAAIERGDNALKINELTAAKAAFTEASGFKPDEVYPKNKLAEINSILEKDKAKEAEYTAAIKAADDALAAKDFETAKGEYTKASGIKPKEQYPKDQITKVNGLLAVQAKKEQDYLAAIEQGDNALTANKYEDAKLAFTNASSINPSEEYPKNKIKEINDFIAKNAEKEKAYLDAIAAADKSLGSEDYETAKTKYAEASGLKPTEAYPKDKIREIEGIIAANAEKEKKYSDAIASGDQALSAEDYDAAKTAYSNALGIKPGEQYPTDKLAEIEGIVVGMQQQEEKYNSAIIVGDDALAAKSFADAKEAYLEATGIKPTESYPQDKLAEIDKIIAEQEAKEGEYAAAIEAGDAAFKSEDWDKASTEYTKALAVKPEETYPQNQLSEIDKKKADLAAEAEAKAKLEADYNAAIKSGDDALANNDLNGAKSSYESALSLKTDEQYPKDKIKEVEGLIAANAEKDANYQSAIAEGDKLFAAENYEGAKSEFEKASGLKPEEAYPKDQLAAIETKVKELADAEAAAAKIDTYYQAAIADGESKVTSEDYAAAIASFTKAKDLKPDETYPSDKIAEIETIQEKLAAEAAEKEAAEALQKQYDDLISKADKEFGSGDLESARTNYQAALGLKSDESYPQTKIDEINDTLADAAEQDKAYQDAISEADASLASEDYEGAKAKYTEASSIKSGEQYPKVKLAEIETKLADIAAKQEEIRIANEQSAELDANFQAAIEEGDAAFNKNGFDAAETAYTKALSLKPEETYPQNQLAAIDTKRDELKSQAEQEAAAAAQAEIDAKYDAAIAEADALFNSEDYDNAIEKYSQALEFKDEQYPKDQLKAIDNKLDEKVKAADQAKIDSEFQGIIAEADALFEANDLEAAKTKYQDAQAVKEDAYPTNQISEIDNRIALLASEAEKEAAEAAAAELEAKYQSAITKADNAFNAENFDAAETAYTNALSIKPEETYPQSQLGIIDAKREEIALKQQQANAEKEEQVRLAKIEQDYIEAINKADNALISGDFEGAKSAYQIASNIKPDETYPIDKMAEIDAKIAADKAAAEASQAELNAKYQETIAKADNAFSSRAWETALDIYVEAQTFKLGEPYPQQKIDEINRILADKKAKEEERKLARERAAANEASYQTAIVEGDNAFTAGDYKNARSRFQLASDLKPDEEYPINKIAEIQTLLDAENAAREEEEKKRLAALNAEKDYANFISSGDDNFEKGGYTSAKSNYSAAIKIKPNESYPREQLAKVNAELEKIRQARLEELRKAYEPIQIQKGPRSSITTDAEDEIDRIYKEMWSKRESDKNEKLEEVRSNFDDINKNIKEKELERRKNAMEQIEEIAITMQLSNDGAEDIYMQNYESVIDKEKAIQEKTGELNRESERERIETESENNELSEKVMKFNTERNEEIIDGKKDMVEKQMEDHQITNSQYSSEQDQRMTQSQERNKEHEKKIREYYQSIAQRDQDDRDAYFDENNKKWLDYTAENADDAGEKIQDYQQEINNQQIEINRFSQERIDNFKENQEKIEEQVEVLTEEEKRLKLEAEKLRQANSEKEYYQGEDRPRQDRMAENYPQGVTEEIIENHNNSTTIRRIVVEGTVVDIYEKTLYSWGGVFYIKNGGNITQEDWDNNSK